MSNYLSHWRAKLAATEEIELSIGPAVIKTSIRLLDLAAAGHIPVALLTDLEVIGRQSQADARQAGLEGMPKMVAALDALAIAAFVDPPLARTGDDDHLAVSDIPFMDKLAVFQRLNQEVEPLRAFQPDAGQPDAAAPAGDDLPHAAVDDPGHRR